MASERRQPTPGDEGTGTQPDQTEGATPTGAAGAGPGPTESGTDETMLTVDMETVVADADAGAAAAADALVGGGDEGVFTGTRDPIYDLVSVLYHALQGAETSLVYAGDAAFADDPELVAFFAEVQAQDRQRAAGAKRLLARYLLAGE